AEVPLGVGAQPGAVVEDTEEDGLARVAAVGEHLARGLVEVAVLQAVDVSDLEEAALARDEGRLAFDTAGPPLLAEAVVLHEAAGGRVARQRSELRLLASQRAQVVVDELDAPGR